MTPDTAPRGAVRAASSRTHHLLSPPPAERDVRYTSADPATDRLWLALHEVSDPELPISLVDLGLIYAVRRSGERAEIELTFTATACPCMAFIREDIHERLAREGIGEVEIREVWDPPWTAERMTAAGRAVLRAAGVAA